MSTTLFIASTIAVAAATASAQICTTASPCVTLNNGDKMPIMALGTWQYNDSLAGDVVKEGLKIGFTHIDTANDYDNQQGVGDALKGLPRDSYFLTTKTPPCKALTEAACYKQAHDDFLTDLQQLQVDYVDLILLHGPSHRGAGSCDEQICALDRGQWSAYEDLYKQGKAKAIGVSNYCPTCMACLLANATVSPAVNQFELHVGMGPDPTGMVSMDKKDGVVTQAYSPLGNGALVTDPTLAAIGKNYNKTGPQIALKYIVQMGLAIVTKASNPVYLAQDLDIFSWNMTAADMNTLVTATTPPGNPSWACSA